MVCRLVGGRPASGLTIGVFAPILHAAERVLSERFGRSVCLDGEVRLSDEDRRNLLLRVRVVSGGPPDTLIIKKVVVDPYNPEDVGSWDTRRFFSDWAGAEFLSAALDPPRSPRFYGGDYASGFFILEDLGHQQSLVEPLLEQDASSAERALVAFGTSLGRLHAATVGQLPRFEGLLRTINPHLGVFARAVTGVERLHQLRGVLDGLEITTGSGLARDLEDVTAAIEHPGPFLSYIHGDPCPDNAAWNGRELRLMDFEFGGFGHALMDGTYGRIMFPTCWCANRIPRRMLLKMEAAYRSELVKGCPEAQDDRTFDAACSHVCGYWMLTTLTRSLGRVIEEDRTWGISTLRQRVLSRLDAFLATTEASDQLPALRETASRVSHVLRAKWPDTEPLPVYPALRKVGSP